MKYIVIINGAGRSGKDSFVQFCREVLEPLNSGVYNISSIDPVKEAAAILGYSESEKNDHSREFLYDLKRAWSKFNNGPFKYLSDNVNKISEGLIFLHIREPQEISKFIKAFPDTKTLLLIRETGENLVNPADHQSNLRANRYDFEIDNNESLEELKRKAEEFIFKDLGVRVSA